MIEPINFIIFSSVLLLIGAYGVIKNKNGKTGKKLSDLNLPDDTLIAMINREGEAIFPDSESSLEENDHVLVFTLKTKLPEGMFHKKCLRFFCGGLLVITIHGLDEKMFKFQFASMRNFV